MEFHFIISNDQFIIIVFMLAHVLEPSKENFKKAS